MDEKTTEMDTRSDMLKVPRHLLNKLRVIAACRRRTMLELIEEYAGARIIAEHRAVIEEQAEAYELGESGA